MSQNSASDYGQTLPVAQAGQPVDISMKNTISRLAEGDINFGRAVVAGTDGGRQVKVADSAAGVFMGVAQFNFAAENAGYTSGVSGAALYLDKSAVAVQNFGNIYMEAADAVVVNADAYVVVAAGADRGKVTDDPTDNLGPIGKIRSAGADGDIVSVEVTAALRGPQGIQGEPGV